MNGQQQPQAPAPQPPFAPPAGQTNPSQMGQPLQPQHPGQPMQPQQQQGQPMQQYMQPQGQPMAAPPVNIVVQNSVNAGGLQRVANRQKSMAIVLAFFLGGIGVHKFYVGENARGILYMLFCWTFIPTLLSWVDILSWVFQPQREFDMKYNTGLG